MILVSETKIKHILGPHNAERTGVGQGELNSLELKKKKKKRSFVKLSRDIHLIGLV